MTGLDSRRVGVVTGPRTPDLTAEAQEPVAEFERRGAIAGPAVERAGATVLILVKSPGSPPHSAHVHDSDLLFSG